ncbi:MAG: DUF5672 family protein [Chitinophagaceae bacterium]
MNFFKQVSGPPSVAVVIPVYKAYYELDYYEQLSLRQCFKVLYAYPIVFVGPRSLDISAYKNISPATGTYHETFDNHYFQDVHGYNALMLSKAFYQRFAQYAYILVYQLDAFVFRDDLTYWCRQGFDYIGAPWLTTHMRSNIFSQARRNVKWKSIYKNNIVHPDTCLPLDEQFYNKVGNGGFSLRKTASFLHVLEQMPEMVASYLGKSRHHFYNEDVFWSLEVNRKETVLKIPHYKTAVHFSIEFQPELAFKLTKGQLPFGCHDWDNYLPFWKEKFRQYGIEL